MKKILGLDLGVTSIGWALVEDKEPKKEIIGMGCRIIPYDNDSKEGDNFTKGSGESKNQKRTAKRSQRRGYDRYQLRRKALCDELIKRNMMPDIDLIKLEKLELWELRDKSITEEISLKELGRILLHLNQKRGYKSARSDANLDKKDTDYVNEVKNRYKELKETGQTIGQHFYTELCQNEFYRIKQQVYPREAYIEEFERILKFQKKYHSEITDELISKLKDEIIYYQRNLKSQKGLVSVCDFEGHWIKINRNSKEKEVFIGPKVAPRSSPLFQVCKIWENINTITLKNKRGEILSIPVESKKAIFNYLDNHEKITFTELQKILGIKKEDGWYGNKQIDKGIQGNTTKTQILKCFDNIESFKELLQFNLAVEFNKDKEVYLYDKGTGEIIEENQYKIIKSDIENQPLYQLWHIIYSIQDEKECSDALIKRFGLPEEIAAKLASIDFTKQAFGNKSVKAIRKILPYLMEGFVYSDACSFAGYNHSDSLTKDENLKRQLIDKLPNLQRNSLRQPVVEKILNQMINLVNAVIDKYGKPDEIRVELARELKQSKKERYDTFTNLNERERENNKIRDRIINEYGLRATRNNIIKWHLYQEINGEQSKANAICIYCGKMFGLTDALNGTDVDVEHIIPKALLFDDSQSNKTLSHRKCNESKGNKTAYDYMKSKSQEEFELYLERVNDLFKKQIIGKTKRDKLLASHEEYLERKTKGKETVTDKRLWEEFIERQIRETQYISKKSREILMQVCYNVWATSGSVTEYLRRTWGWDDVLMNLQLPKYKDMGLTEEIEFEKEGQIHKKEVIKNWSKRDDHRHHAIDALTIACTEQGFIQRINNLNSEFTRDEMRAEIPNENYDKRKNLLENNIVNKKPFNTSEIMESASNILISFKSGKKVATKGNRKIKINGKKEVIQNDIIVPRGALSQEFVYGKIKFIERNKRVKYLFEHPDLIVKPYIKDLIIKRLARFNNDPKKAVSSLKKEPIYLDNLRNIELTYGSCFKEKYIIKYPVAGFKANDIESVIDGRVKKLLIERLKNYDNNEKEAFKDLENKPIWYNEEKAIPIKTVRCFTRLNAVTPVKKDSNGKDIGFVKPGNNHHIAIYIDDNGIKHEHIVTFWHAVERKKYGFPVIIKKPKEIWDIILADPDNYPESFVAKLPDDKWKYKMSMQQNEMFILELSDEDVDKYINERNYKILSDHLYRVQTLSESDYYFRLHTETQIINSEESKKGKRYFRFKSLGTLLNLNPIKVSINCMGEIVKQF